MAEVLEGALARLRPVEERDLPRLLEILREPSVAPWWGTGDPARTRLDLTPPADEGMAFVAEVDGEIAGWIQYYEELEPDYRFAGIDLFLATAFQNRGIGKDMLRTMAHHLFEARGHHRLQIDPALANERAIHVYESVGFERVGVMREYERAPDGTWRDGLLMDMLRAELR